MKTQIKTAALRAAINCVADKKDLRTYQRDILLDFRHGAVNRLRIVSTDGAILFAGQHALEYAEDEQTADFKLLLPIDAVKLALKGAGKREFITLESLPDGRYALGDTLFNTAPANQFPSYERVIPDHNAKLADAPLQFDADLLKRGQDALRAFYDNKEAFYLTHLDSLGSVMHAGSSEALIVIMPLRDSAFSHCNSDKYQGFYSV